MRVLVALIALASALLGGPSVARAALTIDVDLSSQTMRVSDDGQTLHQWAISSGTWGFRTPNGSYRPQRLVRMHYSRQYDMAPMPYSIFFRGGYAIHGTGHTRQLGRPASHGCIRLSTPNAARLFALVQERGRGDARIVITGSPAGGDTLVASADRGRGRAQARRLARAEAETEYAVAPQPYEYAPAPAPRRRAGRVTQSNGIYYYEVSPGFRVVTSPDYLD